MAIVDFPIEYFPDPTKGRPVFNGDIYVGLPDLDPKIVINQIQLSIVEEDGPVVPVAQPIKTNAGGTPTFNGFPVQLSVEEAYSLRVDNNQGSQVYYVNSIDPFTDPSLIISASQVDYKLSGLISGGVDRTQESKNLDVISVKDFGAVGDGIADDTTAVLNAAAAMSDQMALYFPSGIYNVDATLDFTGVNFFSIIGDGWGASIIKRTDGTFGDTILFSRVDPTADQAFSITVRDIQFYCAADMDSGAVVHVKNITRFILQNVFIRNCFQGIRTEGIRDSRFDNIEIISNEFHTVTRANSCHLLIDAPANPAVESTETFFSNFNFTTALGQVDLEHSIIIKGALDGIWFSDGHTFGGDTSNLLIDGTGQSELQGLTFDHVWFDQFTPRNMIIQGVATDKFRLMTFDGCRFWGGSTHCISIDSSSNVQDITFEGCEIGVTQGQGLQVGAGQVLIKGATFKAINQAVAANGYAIQSVGTAAVGTIITVLDSEFECSALSFGIQCNDTTIEYHFQGNCFRAQDANIQQEIFFNANVFNGTCSGNTTGRIESGDITAAASITLTNIAVNDYNFEGATANVASIFPRWHGRRISIKADSAIQNLVSGGNIRNRLNAATNAIAISDVFLYEFRGDTGRWHEL